MTHDPLCPHTEFIPCCESYLEHEYPQPAKQHYVACQCDLIAQVRADERAKYVLPDLPRGGEHVDWCRDLACYGCEEIADGVIAQSL